MDTSNLHSFVGACFGGVVEKLAVYPLDIAKTRIQSSTFKQTSLLECLKSIKREDQSFTRFYRGLSPSVGGIVPLILARGVTFSLLQRSSVLDYKYGYVFTGITMGFIESMIITPFDSIKIALQTKRISSYSGYFNNDNNTVKRKYNTLYQGFRITMLRQLIYSTASCCAFQYYFQKYCYGRYDDLYGFTKLRIGITSGIVATIIGAPVDVIKTRVQNQEMKPNNIINGIRNQITREGIKSLYAGCGTKILRTSIGTFIFLCAYESIMKF